MADRQLLHISKLNSFKEWLLLDGWNIEETKGLYEVLRATKPTKKTPLIVYMKNNAKEHLSVRDKDCNIVHKFINECRKNKHL